MNRLPANVYRRAWARAFWLVMHGTVALLVLTTAYLLASPAVGGWMLLVLLVTGTVGLIHPRLVAPFFVAWNSLAGLAERIVRVSVCAACFGMINLLVSFGGTKADFSSMPRGSSNWRTPPRPGQGSYRATHEHQCEPGRGSDLKDYIDWSRTSGELWAIVLVPFLYVLASVAPKERATVPTNTYTLY